MTDRCTCNEIMTDDPTRHFRGCPMREKYPDHPAAHVTPRCVRCGRVKPDEEKKGSGIILADGRPGCGTKGIPHCDFQTSAGVAYELAEKFHAEMQQRAAGPDAIVYHLARLLKEKIEEANTYRETCKAAQGRGTEKHEQVVRARNILRLAQPHLETHLNMCDDEGFETVKLTALCRVVANEIGELEDNTTEEEGRSVAERLGIDIEKWAEEIRAKVEAAVEAAEKEGAKDGIESETGKV